MTTAKTWEDDWNATVSPLDIAPPPPATKPRYSRQRLYQGMPDHRPRTVAAPGFGSALRAARLALELTLDDLSELIEVEHSTIGRWETGSRHPSRDKAQRLADVLGDEVMLASGFLPNGWIAVRKVT